MDGLAATRAIRASEAVSGRRLAVVALTANALESDRNACLEAGMDDFLAKPMQLDTLRAVIERWLPSPSRDNEPPVLDAARFELLTRGDAALASEFLCELIETADDMLEQLHAQIASGNGVAVAALAHSLKGMATELGALRLRAAAIGLEVEQRPEGWLRHVNRAGEAVAELRAVAGQRVAG
jgi:HPt (histidine-containing phosphotransfer) domain-containing protein